MVNGPIQVKEVIRASSFSPPKCNYAINWIIMYLYSKNMLWKCTSEIEQFLHHAIHAISSITSKISGTQKGENEKN